MITKDIQYIGVQDHSIDLFEGQYEVPNGMAYNSYVICDEKIAVLDTVDGKFPSDHYGIYIELECEYEKVVLYIGLFGMFERNAGMF